MMKKLLILAPLVVAGVTFLVPRDPGPSERLAANELVATISRGEDVDLEAHLEPGKWTLFEYGADW